MNTIQICKKVKGQTSLNNRIGLFSFDGPLYKDKNGKYCSTTLTDEMFSRFFSVVNKLYVAIRVFEDDRTCEEMHMKHLTLPNIIILPVGNLVSAKGIVIEKRKFEKSIEETIIKADMIFARMPSIISNSVAKICIRHNKPYLVEVGGCGWDAYKNHGLEGKLIAPLVYYWERKYVGNAAYATYVTRQFLQRRYPNKNITTNCSNVYLEEQSENIINKRLIKIDQIDVKYPVFGQVVASIEVKYKGEQYFIKAMNELKKRGIFARFEIVGPGSTEYLMKQAKLYEVDEQVSFLGAKKKEEVISWLQSIDVYIQPSKQEGLPRSVIEAMSVGCPCMGSNIAGIPELLDVEYLFDPKNTQQIVEVAVKSLTKSNLKKQAIQNFNRAKEYNLANIEERRQKIFKQYSERIFGR